MNGPDYDSEGYWTPVPEELLDLLHAARDGDEDAWDEVMEYFGLRQLKRLRRRMKLFYPQLQAHEDPEDILQDVLILFFLCLQAGREFATVPEVERHWGRLSRWMLAHANRRHFGTTKRCGRLEISIGDCRPDESALTGIGGDPAPPLEFREDVLRFIRSLPNDLGRFLGRLLSGDQIRDLATRFDVCDGTIHRWAAKCARARVAMPPDDRPDLP